MVTKKLVLFTNNYPYNNGETFLENEISFLSEVFSEVIIVPQMDKLKTKRDVPANVKIDNFIIDSGTRKIYKILGVFSYYFISNFSFSSKTFKYIFNFSIYIKRYRQWIEKFLKNNSVEDTIFYSYWFSSPTSALSITKNRYKNLKYITRIHRGDLYEHNLGLRTFPYRANVLKNINKIFSISEDGKNHIEKKYNIKKKELVSISRLGVNGFNKLAKPSEDDNIRIISCSYLVPVKRLELLINALSILERKNINVIWTHIGSGYLFKKLKDKADTKFKNFVKYKFTGQLTNKEVKEIYSTEFVDAFVNVSSSEGIPVSIMEAYSFGLPAIATNVGGTSEIVNNNNGILLSKTPTEIEIADALISIRAKKQVWIKKKEIAFQCWNKKYNAENNYKDFTKQLLEL